MTFAEGLGDDRAATTKGGVSPPKIGERVKLKSKFFK